MSSRHISATELSKLAACERQILLDRQYRVPLQGERKARAAAGERIHAAIHASETAHAKAGLHGPAPVVTDTRCFIATAVFGPNAPETLRLRAYRDRSLMTTMLGRLAVRVYYTVSPPIAKLLLRTPKLAIPVRWILRAIVPGKSNSPASSNLCAGHVEYRRAK